jgi:carbon storage regulator
MLILGRREGDSILIDGGIKIVVVSCDRHGVRIGIDAPAHVKILRGEIAQQVAQENQAAATPAATWVNTLGAPVIKAASAEPTAADPSVTPVVAPPSATPPTSAA